MGIPEMLATSKDSGGMEGFFNSPIAMILMPRTAARFQEAKRDQMLLAQQQRKFELAGQFADQIEKQDPFAAAMIRADPSAMDNVWTSMYNNNKQKELAGINFKNDLLKQQNQSELTAKLKEAESMLPGGIGAHQATMGKILQDSVAAKTQGPNMPGMPTAGDVASENITPQRMTMALSEDYALPNLTTGNAFRIMQDPKAVEDLQDNRRADIEAGSKTVKVVENGKVVEKALNMETGVYDRVVGEVPKSAEQLKLESDFQTRPGTDGKNHDFGYVEGKGYVKDLGPTKADRDPNIGKHIEKFVGGKKRIMLWSEKDQDYTKDIGEAPPSGGYSVTVDPKTGQAVISYGQGAGGKNNDRTEAEAKGDSLFEGIRGLKTDTLDNFDELGKPQNTAGAANYDRGGGFVMSGPAQVGMGSLKQVAQTYIYAQSGQQAPDSEVNRIMSMVMPALSDKPEMRAFKKKLLANMFVSIRAKTSTWDQKNWEADMQAAPVNNDLKVADPTGSAPPLPESLKKGGITKEFWEANPQYWPEAN